MCRSGTIRADFNDVDLASARMVRLSLHLSFWQKLPRILAALTLTTLSLFVKADCVGTEDPVTQECVQYNEDPRLMPPPPFRNVRLKVDGDPHCELDVNYPVFSIPALDAKIKDWVTSRWTWSRSECPNYPSDTAPEDKYIFERLHIVYTVLRPSSCVLVVYFDIGQQGGGGPPYWVRSALNYDLARHRFLELKDLFENFDALKKEVNAEEPFFLIPGGIVTHLHSGLGGPGPGAMDLEQLRPYRPIQRYWDRTGCDSP